MKTKYRYGLITFLKFFGFSTKFHHKSISLDILFNVLWPYTWGIWKWLCVPYLWPPWITNLSLCFIWLSIGLFVVFTQTLLSKPSLKNPSLDILLHMQLVIMVDDEKHKKIRLIAVNMLWWVISFDHPFYSIACQNIGLLVIPRKFWLKILWLVFHCTAIYG